VLLTLDVLYQALSAKDPSSLFAVDFRHDFWVAGQRFLHGHDLYAWTRPQVRAGISFPYPAVAAALLAPFALFPSWLAGAIFTALCIAAPLATLRVLDVRDWRVYGIVLMWEPVVTGWQTGNWTLLLALGLALIWRYRDRPAAAGAIAALLVSIKPIMFPIGLWLLATRRYRATGYALATGVVVNALAFGVVGFDEIGRWLHLISVQGDILYRKGYAVIASAVHLGLSRGAGTAALIAMSAAAAAATVAVSRRDELPGLGVGVLLMLLASPQVDAHYFALLIVPLAISRPRLDPIWVAPLLLWVCPASEANAVQEVVWWLVAAAVIAVVGIPAAWISRRSTSGTT
jgi:hypothetical protein